MKDPAKGPAGTALILAVASTFTACGSGSSSGGAIPNTPEIQSAASANAATPVTPEASRAPALQSIATANASTSTPIQIRPYSGYYYPWLNFSAGASVVPYLASVTAAQAIIISAGSPARAAYTVELESGQPTFVENTVNGSVTLKAPNTKLVPGTTYFVLGTYDGTTARLYVNGTLEASAPITGGVWNDQTTGEGIGADANGNNPFNGLISNLTILPSTITPTPNSSAVPTSAPTALPSPTANPTVAPTSTPKPSPAPTIAPTPTPKPSGAPNALSVAPASVSLLSVGSTATVQLSEANYSGSFSVSSTCTNIATVVQSGASITLTATGAGSCTVTATDANKQSVSLPLTVTLTNFQFQ